MGSEVTQSPFLPHPLLLGGMQICTLLADSPPSTACLLPPSDLVLSLLSEFIPVTNHYTLLWVAGFSLRHHQLIQNISYDLFDLWPYFEVTSLALF